MGVGSVQTLVSIKRDMLAFARRHKKKLIGLGVVGGAGYYAYRQYVAPLLEDPLVAMALKTMTGAGADPQKQDAEQQQHLEQAEQETFELSVKNCTKDLKPLQELVRNAVYGDQIALYDQKAFKKEVDESGQAEKLFEKLKIWAFTLAVSAAYSVALQAVLRRMQLYMIAAHKTRHTIERAASAGDGGDMQQMMSMMMGAEAEAPAPTEEPVAQSIAIPVEELCEFLQSSAVPTGFFATKGLGLLVEKVKEAVTMHFGSCELSSLWSTDSLRDQLHTVRTQVESHGGISALFREHFVEEQAAAEGTQLGTAQLGLQLCDLTEFEEFGDMLNVEMDWAFGMFDELYKTQISKATAKFEAELQKSGKQLATGGQLPLAKVLPVFKKLPTQLFKEEWIRTLNRPQEVQDFFFQIFTSLDAT